MASLRYGYRCERGAPPSGGPNRADLAANLLDWTHGNAAIEHLQNEFSRMLVHHSHVVGEASYGLQRILERLSPEDIANDPRCEGRWGPWRFRAYWKELERRAAVLGGLRESAIGPTFGQAARALRGHVPREGNGQVAGLGQGHAHA